MRIQLRNSPAGIRPSPRRASERPSLATAADSGRRTASPGAAAPERESANSPPRGATADAPRRPISTADAALEREILFHTRRAARLQYVRGRFARELLVQKGWTSLSFVRLGDYTRERLGMAARTLEEEARVARAFENLPLTFAAFLESELSWTQARLLTTVATRSSERSWIATAKGCDTRTLQHKVGRKASAGSGASPDDDDPTTRFSVRVSREGRLLWRAACELAARTAGKPLTQAEALEVVVAEAASGAPLSGSTVPRQERARAAAPSGSATGAESDPVDEAAGAHTAEGDSIGQARDENSAGSHAASTCAGAEARGTADSTAPLSVAEERRRKGYPPDPELEAFLESLRADPPGALDEDRRRAGNAVPFDRDPELTAVLAEFRAEREAEAHGEKLPDAEPVEEIGARCRRHLNDIAYEESLPRILLPCRGDSARDRLEALFDRREARNPFNVDVRLREIGAAMQRLDADLGRLLRRALESRLHREAGFRTFEDYVEARLDLCARKAWTLIAVERATVRCCGALAEAYREGRLTLMAASRLLPVMGSRHGHAWIERAGTVTLRRLEAEVKWALDRRDASSGAAAFDAPAPPPLDHDLCCDAPPVLDPDRLQMRAQADAPASAAAMVTLHLDVPSTVAGLAEDTMLALRRGSESRGAAFERMLATVLLEWIAVPKHRDPVFERDGWRCAVPGCGSRSNLQDHHIRFRSHGGDNSRDNRVTICAAHHLNSLHMGRTRARGIAPSAIVWELGCRQTVDEPLARLIGDRYVMRA